MSVQAHPRPRPRRALPISESPRVALKRRRSELHLFTYVVGGALFWLLWAAIAVSADAWYWWALVPLAGWTLVLALDVRRSAEPRK